MRNVYLLAALCHVFVLGCGLTTDETPDDPVDERLGRFRAALPSADVLTAAAPEATATRSTRAYGDPAKLPLEAVPVAQGINNAVTEIVEGLGSLVEQEPTSFNEEENMYIWGPFPDAGGEGVGNVAAIIQEQSPGGDYRYTYALLRLNDANEQDLARAVIWGGANPDPESEEYGSGITLWDLEANYAFLADNLDPNDVQLATAPRGRFVAVYERKARSEDVAMTMIYAAFGNFREHAVAPVVNVNYLYGNVDGAEFDVDFIDFESEADYDDNGTNDADELLRVRMAFLNQGYGRAEVRIEGGDLGGMGASVVECWDDSIHQTYFYGVSDDGAGNEYPWAENSGVPENCGPPSAGGPVFNKPLGDACNANSLRIPSLDDLPVCMRELLDCVVFEGPEAVGTCSISTCEEASCS